MTVPLPTWVLVTVRGRAALTGKCLAALMRSPSDARRLIVIDNGSRDATLDELYRMFRLGKIYRLICNQVGTMPQWEKCYAIRQAARLATDEPGEMFAWVDNDVVVKDGWLDADGACWPLCPRSRSARSTTTIFRSADTRLSVRSRSGKSTFA